MEAEFDHQTSTWNVFPNKPIPYEFSEKQKVKSLGLMEKQQQQQQQQQGYVIHLANNAYRLTTKEAIVEFYHAAAGWPVKKTWIAAIQQNTYASWVGLDEHMV